MVVFQRKTIKYIPDTECILFVIMWSTNAVGSIALGKTHVTRAYTGSQMGEIDENGLHPVVRMHGNLTVMATIARKCETLCELIY